MVREYPNYKYNKENCNTGVTISPELKNRLREDRLLRKVLGYESE